MAGFTIWLHRDHERKQATRMSWTIPASWGRLLNEEIRSATWERLRAFVDRERCESTVYPAAEQTFAALEATPPERVRAVLLGQDPYHGPGQAQGLCFSVQPGIPLPPSLKNILREWSQDLDRSLPGHGCLENWAREGVLLLNTVLTVRAGEAHSHRRQGWEEVTDAIIRVVRNRPQPVVFLLWGREAQAKARWIRSARHAVLPAAHPSPLSAHRGFFGSRPFTATNRALTEFGEPPLGWRLPPASCFGQSAAG